MNNGEKQIDDELRFIEKELTNLKTAHQRPLGTLDFFHKTERLSVKLDNPGGSPDYFGYFWVDIELEESAIKPPICQLAYDVPIGSGEASLWDTVISSDYKTFSYRFFFVDSPTQYGPFDVQTVSSIPVKNVSVRYA